MPPVQRGHRKPPRPAEYLARCRATLVAAGQSNPQIAQLLFVSPKTVEGYMRRIFAKLGVSSRAQVAAVMAREEAHAHPRAPD